MSDDVVGMDELEEILSDLDISGLQEVGADEAASAIVSAVRSKARGGIKHRVMVGNGRSGRARNFMCGFTLSAGVADDATGTITATPDRPSKLRALHLQANSAAGALLYGLSANALTVQGRNARVGTGSTPDFALRTWALMAMHAVDIGMVESNATVSLGFTNACGAAVDVSAAALAETTD